ncbi:glycoside hydrolase family 28 protein [Flavobacterium sp. GA093]|uniref:Glycoside hydrolase family 28 protein n=1 Tax=Flavobacterium hydrocarbonoxydans TaxID=2683249 RepID=A0A6I4NJJ7_9FLAO|nr:glycoside hydrolase family 28 protein [Flavobacterium hydrocarbonoxydans]MWB92765.1 glycoside hydrolase family 28 protein [Flavobacterium hydrocarbonoxydans]
MNFRYLFLLLISCLSFAQNNNFPGDKVNEIVNRIQLPVIPSYQINIAKLGAKGDSLTNNKAIFDKAMALCKKNKGGTIIVPKGIYKINGPIHFVSNVNLKLEKGARIKFSDNPDDYLPMVLTSWEGTMVYNYSPLIYAYDCENIAITGEGTLDGEGGKTWKSFKAKENEGKNLSRDMNHNKVPLADRKLGKGYFLRPQMIQFFKCKNILVENIRIEDSPFWCLHLLQSQSITVRGISYKSLNHNNDGIDPEYAKDVLIENVTFDNGDDNVAIKAGRDDEGRANAATPSENIVIRNCNFKGLHGVVIGSEMSAGVQNVFVENCKTGGYLKRGIYLKTNADRGGFIKNIFVRNIQLGEVEDCIYITANYHGEGKGHQSQIENISFSNITCNKASAAGIVIQGFPDKKIKNISLNNIEIKWAKNAISSENAENVLMNEVVIGERATVPSAAK